MTAITVPATFVRLLRTLILSLAAVAALATCAPAGAQSLLQQPPVTKEQVEEANEQAEQSQSTAAEGDNSVTLGLIGLGVLVIGGAAFYILRDAGSAAGGGERELVRKPIDSSEVRGAPKAMFSGEASPGGKVGKRNKRERGKRQRQARKAARK